MTSTSLRPAFPWLASVNTAAPVPYRAVYAARYFALIGRYVAIASRTDGHDGRCTLMLHPFSTPSCPPKWGPRTSGEAGLSE